MTGAIGKIRVTGSVLRKALILAEKLGAKYTDVRVDTTITERAEGWDGELKGLVIGGGTTVGVRALAGGTWGFQSTDVPDPEQLYQGIEYCVRGAVKKAKATKSFGEIKLAEVKVVSKEILPEGKKVLTLEEMRDVAIGISKQMKSVPYVAKGIAIIDNSDTTKHFATSEGTLIKEQILFDTCFFYVAAANSGGSQAIYRHLGSRGGWEGVEAYHPENFAMELANMTSKLLLEAKTPKTMNTYVVADSSFNALFSHEITGHPSEADRVLGGESAWAGRAWWSDRLGQRVGSKLLNVVSDARKIPKHAYCYGTFEYDDEGVPSQKVVHIKDGVFMEPLHSRQTAAIYGVKPNGGMRAADAGVMPIIRMTNTYIEADPQGPGTEEEMIEGIDRGVYLGPSTIPSIDSRRHRFTINAGWGWLIEHGEKTQLLRNISLAGKSGDYFRSIYLVGGPETFRLYQLPNCGKGDPMQIMKVTNGGPIVAGHGLIVGGV